MFNLRLKAEKATQEYPALLAEAERAVASFLHGDIAQRRSGSGQKFWQFRKYQSGDSPRDIDWRRSAKSDKVYTREKEQHSPQSTYLWCNDYAGMEFSSAKKLETKAQHAKILTLAISILLSRGGENIGFLGQGRAMRGNPAIDMMTNLLSENHNVDDLPARSRLPKHARFVAVSDFLQPLETIDSAFMPFFCVTRSGVFLQVLDPAEINLPYKGRYIFETPMDREKLPIDNVKDIRGEYKTRIKNHNKSLEILCEDHGWHFFQHTTDMPISITLGKIWQALHKEGK